MAQQSILLVKGSSGDDVDLLRVKLVSAMQSGEEGVIDLGGKGDPISSDFDAAIRRWQSGVGIIADGVIGPRCRLLLGMASPVPLALQPPLDLTVASRLFPATKPANIARYLPYVEAALGLAGLSDKAMVLAALATIRAETEGFVPIAEFQSHFNTAPGGAPYALYDHRKDLGNDAAGDGAKYRGRGFVQLTGRANYATYGDRIGLPLVARPDLANAVEVAAVLLALFLFDHADDLRADINENKAAGLARARKLVNGGSNGLDRFSDVFKIAAQIWPIGQAMVRAIRSADARDIATPAATRAKRASQTKKDAADLRDRAFVPAPVSLLDEYPPEKVLVDYLPRYAKAGLVLDQGEEGACTGFGLACNINYLRWIKAGTRGKIESVSPRMLYTLARRYDEYAGENYEGSSCRGALKGWFNHGVCLEPDWPYVPSHSSAPIYGYANRAAQTTLGVYYRIDKGSIVDMQAAIAQHGAIYVSAFTHQGWDEIGGKNPAPPRTHADLPVINFDGRPSKTDGHAFAIVGYNAGGFILQNSWGHTWGAGGFAVIGYLDWLANGMDAWVVSLGVPGVVAGMLSGRSISGEARAGADHSRWWDEGTAYRHSIVLGNDGRVSRYLTEDEPPRKLQQQAFVLPDSWFRSQAESKKRLVLYAHGGLNSEADAIARARVMGRYFLANGCYPLFLVWKTGLLESIGDIVSDHFGRQPAAAGLGEWLTDKTDAAIETLVGRPMARPIWSEMKENAGLAYEPRRGGDLLVDAIQTLSDTWGSAFELHLVGHSAGSIALGHLLSALRTRQHQESGSRALAECVSSVHLYAPACTVDFANRHYASDEVTMKKLWVDVLADQVERDDNVAQIYRKSLLYLVSNALEVDVRTPILGMARVADKNDAGWDGSSTTGDALGRWREAAEGADLQARTEILTDPQVPVARSGGTQVVQRAGHGIFDNDIVVVSRTLRRIRSSNALVLDVDDLRGF